MTDADRPLDPHPAKEDLEDIEDIVDAEVVTVDVDGEVAADEERRLQPHDLGIELPADPQESIGLLLAEIAASRRDADGYLDDLQRLAAEFENFRKRTMREQATNLERASQRVVESLLPVLDSFDGAFAHEPQSPSEEKLLGGVRGTYQQLLDVLRKEGLEPIESLAEPFDPEVHEAVSTLADGDGPLVVADELRRGYRLKGRVLRPALVTVDHA